MKKLFVVAVILTLVLVGCGDGDGNSGNNSSTGNTTLTINNNTAYDLLDVEYSSVVFGDINSGKDVKKNVSPGPRYVFFYLQVNNERIRCTTAQVFNCEKDENNVLNITVNTSITTTSDGKTDTLRNIYNTLTSIPGNLREISVTENSISLTWNVVNGATGYNIYRSTSISGTYNKLNVNTITDTEFTDGTVFSNVTYWYSVSAIINGMETARSDAISVTTSLPAPVNVSVEAFSNANVSLTWSAVNGASSYNVYRSSSEAGTYIKVNVYAITDTKFTDTGVSPNMTYYYKVSAVTGITESTQSTPISVTTIILVPGSNLTAKMNWLDNNAENNTQYVIEVTNNESISPRILSYEGKSGITITLVGVGMPFIINLTSSGIVFTVNRGITLVINNIILRGNYESVVYINGGTMIMNEGTRITNGTAWNLDLDSSVGGGGVLINGDGILLMNGGEISDNKTYDSSLPDGGGVYILNGSFTMNNGKICNNTTHSQGGGIYINEGTFNMKGGEIYGNRAGVDGGGVYNHRGTIRMSGGVIYGSDAPTAGFANMSSGYAALSGSNFSLYCGTFVGDTFHSTSGLIFSEYTFRIVDGELLWE